jgi:hypothetical protein
MKFLSLFSVSERSQRNDVGCWYAFLKLVVAKQMLQNWACAARSPCQDAEIHQHCQVGLWVISRLFFIGLGVNLTPICSCFFRNIRRYCCCLMLLLLLTKGCSKRICAFLLTILAAQLTSSLPKISGRSAFLHVAYCYSSSWEQLQLAAWISFPRHLMLFIFCEFQLTLLLLEFSNLFNWPSRNCPESRA